VQKLTDEELAQLGVVDGEARSPKIIASMADEWWAVKQERLKADKVAANLKHRETLLQQAVIAQLQLSGVTSIGGAVVRVSVEKEDQPHVKDWDKFYEYILSRKDFSLLERRPGRAAIKERWDDGVQVPGVEKFPVYKLSKQGVK
jgi:hypothetical protein